MSNIYGKWQSALSTGFVGPEERFGKINAEAYAAAYGW
jgi:hypothetical protein